MNSTHAYQSSSLYQRIGGEAALRNFVSRLYGYMDSLPEVRPVRDLHRMSLDEAGERLAAWRRAVSLDPPAAQGSEQR